MVNKMLRNNPENASPPPVVSRYAEKMWTEVREYKLITPLFGGGVEAGVVDREGTLIRGSSIRGQLRFWWRACRGGQFQALQEMKEAEDYLWGAASTKQKKSPALVQIRVEVAEFGNEVKPFLENKKINDQDRDWPWKALQYAAFPLQDGPNSVQGGITFKLTISYPKKTESNLALCIADEVNATLWAWETFGGIGGRTRRGFGALARLDAVRQRQSKTEVENLIRTGLEKYVVAGQWPQDVPHLSKNKDDWKITGAVREVNAVWRCLITTLKNFRQSRERNHSLWPEPNAIRRSQGLRDYGGYDVFPRAQLGLPIIFHIKDSYDPRDTTLEGKEQKRWASPVILKPLACGNNQAVGLVLRLRGTRLPAEVVLSPKQNPVKTELTAQMAEEIQPLAGEMDVVNALLKKYD